MRRPIDLLREGSKEELWQMCCGFIYLSLEQFMAIQKRLLLEEIELLKNSELGGRVMRGAMPETVEEFREQVPLTTYADYLPEIVEKREDVLPTKPAMWVHNIGWPGKYHVKWMPLSERFLYEFERVAGGVGLIASCDPQGDFPLKEHLKTLLTMGSRYYGLGVMAYLMQQALGYDLTGQRLEVKGLLDRYELEIPLLGLHQMENAAVAVAALEVLVEKGYDIPRDSIVSGLARVKWPGRFDILSRDPFIVVDGAHNRESARLLGESLKRYFNLTKKGQKADRESLYRFNRATLIMGASFDKDVDGIISELGPLFDRFIVTGSQHPRAMSPELLRDKFAERRLKAEVSADIPAALSLATRESGNLICVTGSLFVVGEAMAEVVQWR